MNDTESALRAIKDRVAAALGALDEASAGAHLKANRQQLAATARELHKCADEVQDLLMRLRPR